MFNDDDNAELPATPASLASTPKRSAFSELTNSKNYVSPTANLKLLTQVALEYPTPPPSALHRKEKSLQILCDRFLSMYPLQVLSACELQLDLTATQLGVEKRRMYDIINILEAMQCAEHQRKNTYLWHGGARLTSFLRMLRRQGEALSLSAVLRGRATPPPPPKHKTLGVLAQRFLMLFLVEPPNTLINLEMAVGVLIDNKPCALLTPDQADRQHKSKVRRLYDIANVLISLGLIEKVSGSQILKKPVFVYRGTRRRAATTPDGPPLAKTRRKLNFSPSIGRREYSTLILHRDNEASVAGRDCKPPVVNRDCTTPVVSRDCTNLVTRRDSTTPVTRRDPSTALARRDAHPRCLLAAKRKWDEILEVADMELSRINSSGSVIA